MTTITTRAGKGSALTNNELDANFINLNAEVSPSRPTIRPSLSLDFANSKSVDSRITFTRASSATRYDANGVIQKVVNDQPRIDFDPSTGECKGLLVEEQRTNIVTYSDSLQPGYFGLEYGAYLKRASGVAPDGSFRANLLCADGTSTTARLIGSLPSAGTYTTSFYTKQGASSRSGFWVYASGWVMTDDFTWTNGAPISSQGSPTIVYVGNGWYRMSYTYTVPSAGTILFTPSNYTAATASSSTWFWGIQTEAGSFATSHIPTTETFTSRASSATYFDSTGTLRYAGVNQQRYGYGYDTTSGKWVSQGLVLEAAATNLISYSSSISSQWLVNGGLTLSENAVVAPDGTQTADTLTEVINTGYHYMYTSVSLTTGNWYTFSTYVKPITKTSFAAYCADGSGGTPQIIWYTDTKTVSISIGGSSQMFGSVTDVGNGWYRLSFSMYCISSTSTALHFFFETSSQYTPSSAKAASFWGWQLETGTVATSYIPTYGASVTRAADVSSSAQTTRAADTNVMSGANFSSWYKADEGTFVIEMNSELADRTDSGQRLFTVSDGTVQNTIRPYINSSEAINFFTTKDSASGNFATSNLVSGSSPFKAAIAYKAGDYVASLNGVNTASTGNLLAYNFTQFEIAKYSVNISTCHVKRLAYYPKRLSNTELQALTA